MSWYQSYSDAVTKAEHYIALGQTEIYLDGAAPDLPWDQVCDVTASGAYRLNGPCGCYVIAENAGLRFKWSIDFEERGANGQSVSMFDRDRLRELSRKLPVPARKKFAEFLAREVLPGLRKTTAEWRKYLNAQIDSEDCVRGLIDFANASALN